LSCGTMFPPVFGMAYFVLILALRNAPFSINTLK